MLQLSDVFKASSVFKSGISLRHLRLVVLSEILARYNSNSSIACLWLALVALLLVVNLLIAHLPLFSHGTFLQLPKLPTEDSVLYSLIVFTIYSLRNPWNYTHTFMDKHLELFSPSKS